MGSKAILLLGLVLGLVAAALAYTQVKEEEVVIVGQEFMKLNADNNLAAGDRLLPNMISAVTIPLEFNEVQSVAVAYTPEVEAWLTNNDVRVSKDVLSGSFILHEHLLDDPEVRFSSIISEKGRAVTIPVSEITSVSYFVEPGSRVDILTTMSITSAPEPVSNTGFTSAPASIISTNSMDGAFGALNKRVVTRTIMQNMQVLAVGQATTRNAYLKNKRGYSSITLDVTPEEAEMLTFLMSQSDKGFNLVLRNPVNTSEQDINDVDWQTVTEK